MATVTDEIKRLLNAKAKRVADGQETVAGLLAEVRRQILEELQAVPGDSYSAYHMRQNLASIEKHLQDFNSRAGREMAGLVGTAWEDGEDLVLGVGRASGLFTSFGHVPTTVLETLQDYTVHKIGGVSTASFERIRGELTLGILGQKTPHQVMTAIAGGLDSPGVFKSISERAEVIAHVEMGRAYSTASQLAMTTAQASVPGLQKQWWHAGHPKYPRQSHLALHGQVKPIDKPFMVGSLTMMFPRDPAAPASEVIRCGCDHVPYHAKWGERDGKMIELPIFNERGQEIARRGPRTGNEEPLVGKFKNGQLPRGGGKDTKNG